MIFEGFREVYNKITAFWDGRDNIQSGTYATLFRRNLLLPSSGKTATSTVNQRYYVPPKNLSLSSRLHGVTSLKTKYSN
jgi:bisphosphoglycerate-independent phosphoglycerate mutase (AlkP superfamily)